MSRFPAKVFLCGVAVVCGVCCAVLVAGGVAGKGLLGTATGGVPTTWLPPEKGPPITETVKTEIPNQPATPPPGTPGGSPKPDQPGGGAPTPQPKNPGLVSYIRTKEGRLVLLGTGRPKPGEAAFAKKGAADQISRGQVDFGAIHYPNGQGGDTAGFPPLSGTEGRTTAALITFPEGSPVTSPEAAAAMVETPLINAQAALGDAVDKSNGRLSTFAFGVQLDPNGTSFLLITVVARNDPRSTLIAEALSMGMNLPEAFVTSSARTKLSGSSCVSRVDVVPGRGVVVGADRLCPGGVAFKDGTSWFSRLWVDWGVVEDSLGNPVEHAGSIVVHENRHQFEFVPAPGVEGVDERIAVKVSSPLPRSGGSSSTTTGSSPPPPGVPPVPGVPIDPQPLVGGGVRASSGLGGAVDPISESEHFGMDMFGVRLHVKSSPVCTVDWVLDAVRAAGGRVVAGEVVLSRGQASFELPVDAGCVDADRDAMVVSHKETSLMFGVEGEEPVDGKVWVGRNDDRRFVSRFSLPGDRFFVGEGRLSLVVSDRDDLPSKRVVVPVRVEDRGPRCHASVERGVMPGNVVSFSVKDLCPVSAGEKVVFQPVEKSEGGKDDDPAFPFSPVVGKTVFAADRDEVSYSLDRGSSLTAEDVFFVQAVDERSGERSRPVKVVLRGKRPPVCDITRLKGFTQAPVFSFGSGVFSAGSVVIHRDALVRGDGQTTLFNGLIDPSPSDLCVSDVSGEKITMGVVDPSTGNVLDEGLFDRPAGYLYVSSLGAVYYPKRSVVGTDTVTLVAKDPDGLQTRVTVPIEVRDVKPECEPATMNLSVDGDRLVGETTVRCKPRTDELTPLSPTVIHVGHSTVTDGTLTVVKETEGETTVKYSIAKSAFPEDGEVTVPVDATIGAAQSEPATLTIKPPTP